MITRREEVKELRAPDVGRLLYVAMKSSRIKTGIGYRAQSCMDHSSALVKILMALKP